MISWAIKEDMYNFIDNSYNILAER